MAGGVANLKGGVPIRQHRPNKSNIEQAENEANFERRQAMGFQKYPMHVHKPGGLVREVKDDADLADAMAKGWYEDVREVPETAPTEEPTKVSQMTVAQAKKFIAKVPITALPEIEQDEMAHGHRAEVMQFIADAKDAAGGKPTKAAAAKAVKAPPKKK